MDRQGFPRRSSPQPPYPQDSAQPMLPHTRAPPSLQSRGALNALSEGSFGAPAGQDLSESNLTATQRPMVSGRSHSPGPPNIHAASVEKTRLELGKLLRVALQRLRERERPPSIFDALSTLNYGAEPAKHAGNLQATVNAVRGAVRLASSSSSEWHRGHDPRAPSDASIYDGDEDEDIVNGQDHAFSTEVTFQHLTVVRDTLMIEGKKLFLAPSKKDTDSRSNLLASQPDPVDVLREELVATLAEVVKEDCRYKVTRFRPLCPPNALQGVALETAAFLARLSRHDSEYLVQLGFAMLPAFSTFPSSLHERVMKFFEIDILGPILFRLSESRNNGTTSATTGVLGSTARNESIPEIQVEWAIEETSSEVADSLPFKPWASNRSAAHSRISWTSPRQPMENYRIGSLISPLLAAMFRAITLHSRDHSTLFQFHKTLATIVRLKEDAYTDLVDVIAFESAPSRLMAIRTLTTFWPREFGHVAFSRQMRPVTYEESLRRIEDESYGASKPLSTVASNLGVPRSAMHEFLLWRFFPAQPNGSNTIPPHKPSLRPSATCTVCLKVISGAGLFCPCCTMSCHIICYDHEAGSDRLKYNSREEHAEKMVTLRYSRHFLSMLSNSSNEIRRNRHHFEPVNLFSLTLCFLCRSPCWGCYQQGLRCSSCLAIAHPGCMSAATEANNLPACRSIPFSYKSVTIQWDLLRRSWVDFYSSMIWKEEELFQKTYEDVSTAYGVFWMEAELLSAGVASGTLVIQQSTSTSSSAARPNNQSYDNFELHYFTALYLAQLPGRRLSRSRNTIEYLENGGSLDADVSLLHDIPLLLLAVSATKLPHVDSVVRQGTAQTIVDNDSFTENLPHPFETVSLAHIRDALGHEVGLHSESTVRCVMAQLHRLGLFSRIDYSPNLLDSAESPDDLRCSFPSTLAIDASTSVEALFTSIQACLDDLDVSVNEFGFLLLVRRCWPSNLMTDYALSRLACLVLSWILTEDDRLLQIVRDYVATGEPLPGVNIREREERWPFPKLAARANNAIAGSGTTDYTHVRRALMDRYANRWLHQLHDLNQSLYAECLYQQCHRLSERSFVTDAPWSKPYDLGEPTQRAIQIADATLKYIVKLCQWNVVWTTFDELFVHWLDMMSASSTSSTPAVFKNLPRLFSTDDNAMNRTSVADEDGGENFAAYLVDPWRVIVHAASEDTAGLERCLQWLLVLARSGVEIPNHTLMQLSAFARDFSAPFITHAAVAEVVFFSVWIKAFGRESLLQLISDLYARQISWMKTRILKQEHLELVNNFLRHTLGACLLLYGCKREVIASLELLDPAQLTILPQRRRSNVPRGSHSTDLMSIDMDMLDLLSVAAIEGTAETCLIVAKFLSKLITETSFLSADEVDHFVMLNGYTFSQCAWHFYSQTQIPQLCAIRTGFLLRLLVVDTQPFETLLDETFDSDSTWETRFSAINRIFRIILDVSMPGLDLPTRQWRPSVVRILMRFFSTLWKDDRVEVRLTCDTLTKTLLPTHMETMSLCFEEYLAHSTVTEKMSLATFLTAFHPVLPSWRLISWPVLVQALGQDTHNLGDSADMLTDSDDLTLRATFVNLGLQMIADGIMADLFSLLRIKLCLVRMLGFQRCEIRPGRGTFRVNFDSFGELPSSGTIQLCLQGVMRALDTSQPCDLPPSCMVEGSDDVVVQGFLSSIFVDVVIRTINSIDLSVTPYLATRTLLTSLVIILSKHDLTSKLLSGMIQPLFRAVHAAMQLLLLPYFSLDLKQIVFNIGSAALKQLHVDRKASTTLLSEYVTVITTVVIENGVSSDHTLAVRGKQFFHEMLMQFTSQKIFLSLFKYPCSQDFFVVLGQVLREQVKSPLQTSRRSEGGDTPKDAVVREILAAVQQDKKQPSDVDLPLRNLATFVELVHHSNYPESLVDYVGAAMSFMASHVADWKPSTFDASALLRICIIVAQHHKLQSKELLLHCERYLRVVLGHFPVQESILAHLLQVSASSSRRLSRAPGISSLPSIFPNTIVDAISAALKGRLHGQPSTIRPLLNTVSRSLLLKDNEFTEDQLGFVGMDGVSYLLDRAFHGPYTDSDFELNESLAKVVLQVTRDVGLVRIMASYDAANSTRLWSFLLVTVLDMDWSDSALSLWRIRHEFSRTFYKIATNLLSTAQSIVSETASIDLSYAFMAVRLWLLLIQQICDKTAISTIVGHHADRDQCEQAFWNDVWPSYERVLQFSIQVASYEEYQTSVALIWQSFADLVALLHHSRSILAGNSSLVLVLDQMKQTISNDSLSSKVTKAARGISIAPNDPPVSVQVELIRKDFAALEKLGWSIKRRMEERGREEKEVRRQVRQPTAG